MNVRADGEYTRLSLQTSAGFRFEPGDVADDGRLGESGIAVRARAETRDGQQREKNPSEAAAPPASLHGCFFQHGSHPAFGGGELNHVAERVLSPRALLVTCNTFDEEIMKLKAPPVLAHERGFDGCCGFAAKPTIQVRCNGALWPTASRCPVGKTGRSICCRSQIVASYRRWSHVF